MKRIITFCFLTILIVCDLIAQSTSNNAQTVDNNLIDQINKYNGTLLLFLTGIYVIGTFLMYWEMKKTRELYLRPFINGFFTVMNENVFLKIENISNGSARKVRIDIKPKLINIIAINEIPYLAGHTNVIFAIDKRIDFLKSNTSPFIITIAYECIQTSKKYSESFTLDPEIIKINGK